MTMTGKWVAYWEDGSTGYGQVHCVGEKFALLVDVDGALIGSVHLDHIAGVYDTDAEAARAEDFLASEEMGEAIDAAPEVVEAQNAVNSMQEARVVAHAALDRARDEAEKRLLAKFMARPADDEAA